MRIFIQSPDSMPHKRHHTDRNNIKLESRTDGDSHTLRHTLTINTQQVLDELTLPTKLYLYVSSNAFHNICLCG